MNLSNVGQFVNIEFYIFAVSVPSFSSFESLKIKLSDPSPPTVATILRKPTAICVPHPDFTLTISQRVYWQ